MWRTRIIFYVGTVCTYYRGNHLFPHSLSLFELFRVWKIKIKMKIDPDNDYCLNVDGGWWRWSYSFVERFVSAVEQLCNQLPLKRCGVVYNNLPHSCGRCSELKWGGGVSKSVVERGVVSANYLGADCLCTVMGIWWSAGADWLAVDPVAGEGEGEGSTCSVAG